MKGAQNRLLSTKQLLKDQKCQFFVAFENGIINTGVPSAEWIDLAWTLLEDESGERWVTTSGGLPFAVQYVSQARELGFNRHTAGDVMAKALNCNSKDPHSYLTHDKVTRENYLFQALLAAIGQYLRCKTTS